MTTARRVAADVLHRSRDRAGFAGELVDAELGKANLSAQDRRFVTQLVFGVIRRQGSLDALLTPFLKTPLHAVQPRVRDVLHLGAYQLAFLTHVPKHAAVHEAVELAEHVGSGQARGFVNGVLRKVADLITDEFGPSPGPAALPFDAEFKKPPPPQVTVADRRKSRPPGARASGPLRAGGPRSREVAPAGSKEPVIPVLVPKYRKLNQPILPDPTADPVGYWVAGFSWPRWLAHRWLERYGPAECRRLGFWFNSPPPLWIRVNKLRVDRGAYQLQLAASLVEAEAGDHPQSLRLLEHVPIRDLPGYDDGDFTVQDHSSMVVASAVSPQPGNRLLDLCSAPGGKTTHLAELADNRAKILACDIDPKRLDTVMSLCRRLKVEGVEPVVLGENAEPPAGPFDAAIVDVPCSNTGVMGRRPEVRWRLRPGEFDHLIRLQTKLLIQAIERVKPRGIVVYSTCSIEPDENEGVVNAVGRAVPNLVLEAEHHAIPGAPSDGGYWARIRKLA
ncbi:MAG: hypothetical protein K2X87_22290 [Gemmataceae bacterium]|nr:hypothetical protein [Gemmataceae bacterium]